MSHGTWFTFCKHDFPSLCGTFPPATTPLYLLCLLKVVAISLPGQGRYSLRSTPHPPRHPLYHLGLVRHSPRLNEGERAWACPHGSPESEMGRGRECVSPDAITGSLLGPLPPLWVFTGVWIPQAPLRACTDHRGTQHMKPCDKATLCLPGPLVRPGFGTPEKDTRCQSKGRSREGRLLEGGTNPWLMPGPNFQTQQLSESQ